jgi:hypothetical protein
MAISFITSSLEVATQQPLDSKVHFKTFVEMRDLGPNNINTYKYHNGMFCICHEDKSFYVWREVINQELGGVLLNNHLYPENTISDGFDYSNKLYNFFILQHDPQFTNEQKIALLELIYSNNFSSISIIPNTGEKGFLQSLNINYSIQNNDDIITEATINQGIGDVIASVDDGLKTIAAGTSLVTKTFQLFLEYNRNNVLLNSTLNATYNAYTPQWAGWSNESDFVDNYDQISNEINLQKFIQNSPSINKSMSPSGVYIWFISIKDNATILDKNNFEQTVGSWSDETKEFWKKSLVLTLSDEITTSTVYLYRTREVKTLNNFIYKIL